MKWAEIRRKLGRVDRAIDKAIANTEIPGAVVMARVLREKEVVEHLSVRGMAAAFGFDRPGAERHGRGRPARGPPGHAAAAR